MRAVRLLALVALGGCVSSVTLPVTGHMGREVAQGQTTASLVGESSFWAATASGLRCDGTYDALDQSPVIEVSATCNDGRTVDMTVTRVPTGGGSAEGVMSDGTPVSFWFGNNPPPA